MVVVVEEVADLLQVCFLPEAVGLLLDPPSLQLVEEEEAEEEEEECHFLLMAKVLEEEEEARSPLQLLELLRELLRLRLASSKAAATTLTRLSLAGHREVEGHLTSPRSKVLTTLVLLLLVEEDLEAVDRLLPSIEVGVGEGEEDRLRKSKSTIRCRFPCT